ncbi:hypothetical protein JTB14_031744 [Gonioctena quinquepunctata]|nr:hypothetical protein JTB14_031744 [Gonioctena quinquepunctata]
MLLGINNLKSAMCEHKKHHTVVGSVVAVLSQVGTWQLTGACQKGQRQFHEDVPGSEPIDSRPLADVMQNHGPASKE